MRKHNFLVSVFAVLSVFSAELAAQDGESRPYNAFFMRNLRIGFSVPTARPMAMGGAAIALADDANSASINPAGGGSFARPAVSTTHRWARAAVDLPGSDCPGGHGDSDDFFDQTLVSTVLPVWKIRISTIRETVYDFGYNTASVQPAFSSPGMSAEDALRQNSPSRTTTLNTRIIDNGLTIAAQIAGVLNIGGSLRYTQMNYHLSEREYMNHDLLSPGFQSESCTAIQEENLYLIRSVNEEQGRLGVSAGMLASLHERLKIGIVYHQRPSFDLENNIFLPDFSLTTGDSVLRFDSEGTVIDKIRFNLPNSFGIGFAYKYPGKLNIAVDLLRFEYSDLKDAARHSSTNLLNLVQDDDPGGVDPEGGTDLDIKDRWEYHAGIEYILQVGKQLGPILLRAAPLRAGYYFQPVPSISALKQNKRLEAVFPEQADQHHLTVGGGILWGDNVRLDVGVHRAWPESLTEITGSAIYYF